LAVPKGQSDISAYPEIFEGSEDNVLDRFYKCARRYKLDRIVRLTGDCPLLPPSEIDRVVNALTGHLDYVTNRPAAPDGWDVEAMTFEALEEAYRRASDPYEQEHVTPYIKQNLVRLYLDSPKLSLDTLEDYERIINWYELNRQSDFGDRWDGQFCIESGTTTTLSALQAQASPNFQP
jgi:spore coat polysaccharide biosynthesis protein SpsF (cytidylyltransferase family)